ncbi:MAG: Ribonuclease Z [Candidatus Anoxychlamydiales bacterium]|nr:Ribonuclease Z [Candidatus Anoxychlamydiales bacterium]NGX36718.1 Ribonuclease Z [Candidatus Anoxychlamydiales bacterium]
MSDKDIIILGSSSQQPTRKRNHGAYLIRWNEEGLLFDPGEGTQRQFIFANIAPTCVNRIFVSHFHGDHCLGLGSMLMRLNLDKVDHTVHCYYPKSHQKNFDYLRHGCVYHQVIDIKEHPVAKDGLVQKDDKFIIEANFLEHGIDSVGWRITEKDRIKFDKEKLKKFKVFGPNVRKLEEIGEIVIDGKTIRLTDVSWVRKGDAIAVVLDTKYTERAVDIAKDAKILICESTFLETEKELARKYLHMTAKEAATVAKKANVQMLILTHFSARYTDLSLFEKEARAVFENTYVAEDFKKIKFPN